jgi:hypothetical protein
MKKVLIQHNKESKHDLAHDYDIHELDYITELFYSDDSEWVPSIRNTLAAKLENTGNGLIIKINGLKKIKLDYSQAQQLFILLKNDNGDWKIKIKDEAK